MGDLVERLRPTPNYATVAAFSELAAWFEAVRDGRWHWGKNSRCKYVEIRLDTRAGAYLLQDRDGNAITPEQLAYQYTADAPDGLGNPTTDGGRCGDLVEGNDIWEALFGILEGNVPDALNEDVCQRLAGCLNTSIAAHIERLTEALEPFVAAFEERRGFYVKRYRSHPIVGETNFDAMPDSWGMEGLTFSMGDFRRARAALNPTTSSDKGSDQ